MLVAVGFATPFHWIVTAPDGAVAFAAFTMRRLPAVAVLTVQPVAEPSPLGCEASVDDATEKPDGVVQPPVSEVQNWIPTDLIAVADGTALLVKVYDTPVAPPTDVDRVILRPVIAPALANGAWMNGATTSKSAQSTFCIMEN